MQSIFTRNPFIGIYSKVCGLSIAAIFLVSFAADNPVNKDAYGDYKKSTVKIYPNPSTNGIINITTNEVSANRLHFYIFDLEGTLMHRVQFRGRDKKTITGLKKGIYMYDVFKNDESIERGKIIVK